MTEHLELSRNDLRRAIVETLQSRPHQSCKKTDLPNEVCKQSNINLKGNVRKRLKGIIRREMGSLTRAKIIQEYAVKNIRLRLTPNYLNKYERLRKMKKGEDTVFDSQRPHPKNTVSETERQEHPDFWGGNNSTSGVIISEGLQSSPSNSPHSTIKTLPEFT